jgi:hypothetical protein
MSLRLRVRVGSSVKPPGAACGAEGGAAGGSIFPRTTAMLSIWVLSSESSSNRDVPAIGGTLGRFDSSRLESNCASSISGLEGRV